MITPEDVCSPLGPLRRETFRDPSETVFSTRVGNLLAKAQLTLTRKVPDESVDTDDTIEALTLALAYEQAASIWAGLPSEESVSGEASFTYLTPDELRKEATLYAEKYASIIDALVTPVGVTPPPRRSGRLRRV